MRYLGILCVRNRNRRYRYVEQLKVSLEKVCVRVLEIYGENPGLREAGTLLRTHDFGDCTGIILLKDDVFGSFYDLNGLLKAMEKKYDLWGLDFDTVRSQVENCPVLCESFLVINERLMHLYDLKQALETNTFGEYLLYGSGIVRGCMVSGPPVVKAGELDMCLSMPYEAVAGKRVPFLPIEIFTLTDRILKYSLQHELRRVLEYLEKEEFVTDGIWEYIIAEVNVGDLRRLLHLDYLIAADRTEVHSLRDKRVAVFAHIYYDDLYERCIAYLKRLPEEVDIYVSTKQKGMSVLREKLAAASVPVKLLMVAGERGRDAGALLLGFAPYVKNYDYICFIHDKKSSGGRSPVCEGMSFMDLVWDNLMSGRNHVCQIIELFEKQKYLGLLAPPIPIMGIYLTGLLGNEWTICYEETQKLAESLCVPIRISREKLPFVLSTCFWCRPEALQDLFNYPWKIEDFPEEPLNLDGTVNHAIERILPYLAQHRGYYSALVYELEYASVYTSNLNYIADILLKELWKNELVTTDFPVDLYAGIEFLRELCLFIRLHKEIYIYGAGAQAKRIKRKLDMLGTKPTAFLVSDWKGNRKEFEGCPVRLFAEVQKEIDQNAGIIVAMSNKFADEVIPCLEGRDCFRIDVE